MLQRYIMMLTCGALSSSLVSGDLTIAPRLNGVVQSLQSSDLAFTIRCVFCDWHDHDWS